MRIGEQFFETIKYALVRAARRAATMRAPQQGSSPSAVFLVNLLQDVSVLRPLVFLAREQPLEIQFLVSSQFLRRDSSGVWMRELDEIAEETGASRAIYYSSFEVNTLLQGRWGLLIAGSESNLSAHSATHDVFRIAPTSFVRVTLQHGFECVGLLQSRDHDLAHGRAVTFAADVVCSWFDEHRLSSLAPSQRGKVYVSGPPLVLHKPPRRSPAPAAGIVCENLHSVRLNVTGNFKAEFMSVFGDFCAELQHEDRNVVLRPHPGGQYVIKNKVALPKNVSVNNDPIYKVDLAQYAYGISAPSSVLIDMALAGIPVAVWRDAAGRMDADNYAGLTEIHSVEDWLNFAREASEKPERFLAQQRAFIERQAMPIDPADVRRRFEVLFASSIARSREQARGSEKAERVLFVSNANLPTLEISFVLPLRDLVRKGEMAMEFLTEQQMKERFGRILNRYKVRRWVRKRLSEFQPTLVVFCRYSGPHGEYVRDWARRHNVPTIYHIDDDLLNVPLEIVGQKKFDYHNKPSRRAAVKRLLGNADLVYCSTRRLADRLEQSGDISSIVAGEIYCGGDVRVAARNEPVSIIGYMGFDHAYDFRIVVPALVTLLRQNPKIRFELLGAIPKPPELDEFGERIRVLPPIRGYEEFFERFSKRGWQIGICPLAHNPFNLLKAETKWIEYTCVGAAVVASGGSIYDQCCADGCGLLANSSEEWMEALARLVRSPEERFAMVERAQQKVREKYSTDRLRDQVLEVFKRAKTLQHDRKHPAARRAG